MSLVLHNILSFLWRFSKIAFEVFVLDFLASFMDGYRNTRWRQQEQHAQHSGWARL